MSASNAHYVGGETCKSCHQEAYAAWRPSQHAGAMKHAADSTVLGDFRNARFNDGRLTTRFFRRDSSFVVNTEGPDGKLHDYVIKYTFGLYPLQQYLVEFENGRIQSLTIAWDARPKDQGGQKWFTLYPGEKITPGESIHWTQRDQNWNFMCAECHSTNVKKNYEPVQSRFTTSWSDISVSCEACHGAGSTHVAWASKESGAAGAAGAPAMGLVVQLDERKGVTWTIDSTTGNSTRSALRRTDREVETCGLCHSRRAQLRDGYVPGQPLGTTEQVSLLEPGLFWPDGQMRGEVYNYAPFLQSRMFHQGVTCSDCHEPHSQQLRAPGAQVCLRCHQATKFTAETHGHHPAGASVTCVDCHMPASTFMVIDRRHDHSFRVPRPEQSVEFGVPNTCNQCHKDKSAQWAADQVVAWYGHAPEGYQRYADALYRSSAGLPGSLNPLTSIVGDTLQPAIARATAASRLAPFLTPSALSAADGVIADPRYLLRGGAVTAVEQSEPAERLRLLIPRLSDSVLAVRIEAARALVAERSIPDSARPAFDRALKEYIDVQLFNADRPEAWTNLGTVYAERGDGTRAVDAFNKALALDSAFVPGWVNLADYYRSAGQDGAAQAALRAGLRRNPDASSLHYALGLTLIRAHDRPGALAELRTAARLAPDDARTGYVYGIALHDSGKPEEGILQLEAVLKQHPNDRDVLQALLQYTTMAGEVARANGYSLRLQQVTAAGP
jgi:predicted CXXCH cytochrome family protein